MSLPYVYPQTGGKGAFQFLTLPASPRGAAMGGALLSTNDNDLSLALANPSLIARGMNNRISLNFVDFYGDINYGFVSYSRTFNKFGSFAASVQYIDYGAFTYADDTGLSSGMFKAGESAIVFGWGRRLDSLFSIGANLKTILSNLESYSSFGLAVDVSATYHTPDGLTATLVASNIGRQITTFSSSAEALPFNLQFGVSKKLTHVPLRYSILLTHLNRWDLRFNDPLKNSLNPITGETAKEDKLGNLLDNVMRHVVIGAEITPVRALSLRLGYDYRLRQELKVDARTSTVGFSWGLGIHVARFQFNFARRTYHLEGSPNFIGLIFSL